MCFAADYGMVNESQFARAVYKQEHNCCIWKNLLFQDYIILNCNLYCNNQSLYNYLLHAHSHFPPLPLLSISLSRLLSFSISSSINSSSSAAHQQLSQLNTPSRTTQQYYSKVLLIPTALNNTQQN